MPQFYQLTWITRHSCNNKLSNFVARQVARTFVCFVCLQSWFTCDWTVWGKTNGIRACLQWLLWWAANQRESTACVVTLMQYSNIHWHSNKSNSRRAQQKQITKHEHRQSAALSTVASFWDIFAGVTFRCFQGHSRPASGQPSVCSHPMRRPVIGAPWPCPLLSAFKLTGEMPGQTQ